MNRIRSFSAALCLLVSVPFASHAAPSSRIESANTKLRSELKQGMLEGAAKHNIQIVTDGIVFASRDDGLVASTGIVGFTSLTYDHLARGAVVGLAYLSGFGITPGFYRVYVLLPKGAPEGTAYLLDEADQIVLRAIVTSGTASAAPDRGKYTTCVGPGGISQLDYHSNLVDFEVLLPETDEG